MSPLKQSKNLAARMGRWSASHWKTAVFGWLAFVAVSVFISMQIPMTEIKQSDAAVGESAKAERIIDRAGFNKDEKGEDSNQLMELVLLQSDKLTVKDPAFKAAIADTTKTLRGFSQVTELMSPAPGQGHADLVAPDRHAALVQFIPKGTYAEASADIDEITTAIDKVQKRHPGLYVENAGLSTDKQLQKEIQGGLALAGMISIPLTIIILLFVLRSLVAAALPLLLGLTSVIASTGLIAVTSRVVPASSDIMEVVLLIGLAVGVDYTLFYIRREREERQAGRSEGAALAAAAATSGRTILVSGITVLIAMAGRFLSGDKTFMSFSVGAMVVVAVAMVGSLTVIPGLLGRLGDKVERGRIPFVQRRREVRPSRIWGALTNVVLRHPVVSAIASAGVLLVLAVPTLSLHTSQTGMEGISSSAIVPFQKVTEAFPGSPAPAVIAIKGDVKSPEVRKAIRELRREAFATHELRGPFKTEISRDGTAEVVTIALIGDGTDRDSVAALSTLREDVLPETLDGVKGIDDYAVSGWTAQSTDFNNALSRSMPKVFGFVLLFAFGLLLVSFRSIVIALKAIVLNLLSVGAAYGVMVAFFQWSWGDFLLDFDANGGIANWLPTFMFVILFGLSMDYHVFILSRIREAFDRGLDTDDAISYGIKSTASTVTSAATVMVGVFAVFALLPLVDLKEMGIGLAAAVLIDATIVRGVLLPTSMKLLGEANWYLPKWLQWLPRLEHERAIESYDRDVPLERAA
jgi:RND superfamily putative drug exporter